MKKIIMLFIVIVLVLVGCNQNEKSNNMEVDIVPDNTAENNNSTKKRIYSSEWDGNPLIVKQKDDNDDYKTINEITDRFVVEELIKNLKNADWEENVDTDILPADYSFTWNSFNHGVWVNDKYNRIAVIIAGQSNYGVLSEDSSKIVFKILTGEQFK